MAIGNLNLKIAVNHNNTAGYVSIVSITAPGDSRAFVEPRAWYNYNPGQFKKRSDGSLYIRGRAATAWIFTFLTKAQYVYLSDTYCSREYDGDVTVRTRIRDDDTYFNINARMELPKPSETVNRLGRVGDDIVVKFTNVVVI